MAHQPLRWIVAVGLVLVGVAITVAIALEPIAEWLLRERLEAAGIEVNSLAISTLDPSGVALRDLSLGTAGAELRLERAEATWTPTGLVSGTVDTLRLDGLLLEIERAVEPLAAGALAEDGPDPYPTADPPEGPSAATGPLSQRRSPPLAALFPLPIPPFRAVEVSNARVRIATPGGRYSARGEASAAVEDDRLLGEASVTLDAGTPLAGSLRLGPIATTLALAVEASPADVRVAIAPAAFHLLFGGSPVGHGGGDPPRDIRGELPATSIRASSGNDGTLAFEIETRGGWVAVPGLEVEARGLDVDVRGPIEAPGNAAVSLQVRELRDTRRPERMAPVSVTVGVSPGEEAIAFQGAARRIDDVAAVDFAGHFDPATGALRTDLHLQPVLFAADGLQPADLTARVGDFLSDVSGTVEAVGTARWQAGAIQGTFDIALRDVAATAPNGRVEAVNAVVRVNGPSPVTTPPGQLLSIGSVDVGIGLQDVRVAFQILSETSLAVESAELHFAGGTLRTQGILDLGADEQRLPVDVAGVDLSELLALVKLDGLEGTGSVSGLLPVARRAEAIEIRDGRLESPAGGRIRYRPDAGMARLARNQQSLRELFDALEDFRYEQLTLRIDGTTEGDVQLSLHLAGANPRYRDGYPVEFNLNLEARLVDLLRREQAAYRLADDIADRLGAFTDRAANIDGGSDVEVPEPGR